MQGLIFRDQIPLLKRWLKSFPAVAILGPRQVGKSTLAQEILKTSPNNLFLDLEKPSDQNKLQDPELFFGTQKNKLICLDEIQRLPEIFPTLRSILDEGKKNGQLLILGSASPELLKQSSESLAGRIAYLELPPFTLHEVLQSQKKDPQRILQKLWLRGGFPRSFLAKNTLASFEWREAFVRTFLERDIPQLGIKIPSETLRRFWLICAHLQGQILNSSKLGQSFGASHTTIRHYLDLLQQTYIIRLLPPFENNLKKRLVKSPKLYLRDSGLLHALLNLKNFEDLLGHPVYGNSWEGFVIENILNHTQNKFKASFYSTATGNEIDLILENNKKRLAVECKASTSPTLTKGFYMAAEDLKVDQSFVIAPVKEAYFLSKKIQVIPLHLFLDYLSS